MGDTEPFLVHTLQIEITTEPYSFYLFLNVSAETILSEDLCSLTEHCRKGCVNSPTLNL